MSTGTKRSSPNCSVNRQLEQSSMGPKPKPKTQPKAQLHDYESFLLERKQVMFAEFVTWDEELVDKLKEVGVLSTDDYGDIMSQPTNWERWARFSARLTERGRPGDVDRLCEALRLVRRVWTAEETAADLRVERGELQIDEDINWVAGWEVHRHHGVSKRLSEAEKKLLQRLIAERTQVTLSAWIKQKDSTEDDFQRIKAICDARDKMAAEVGDNTRKFVDANKARLRNAAMLVSRQSVLSQFGGKEVTKTQIQMAEEEINELRHMTSHALLEMESLLEERRRGLRLLNLDEETNSGSWRMDEKLKEALKAAAQSIVDAKNATAGKEDEKEELERRIRQLKEARKEELEGLDKEVLKYKDEVARMDVKLERQDAVVETLRCRDRDLNAELDEWKARCEELERSRRLSQLYQRDGYAGPAEHTSEATASSGRLRSSGVSPRGQTSGEIGVTPRSQRSSTSVVTTGLRPKSQRSGASLEPIGIIPGRQKPRDTHTPDGSVRTKPKKKTVRKSTVAGSAAGRVTSEYRR